MQMEEWATAEMEPSVKGLEEGVMGLDAQEAGEAPDP